MTNLLTLAQQIEQATEDQQQDMLIAAWGAMFPFISGDQAAQSARWESWTKFSRMLAAKAYESAAMMLVPEGYAWMAGCSPGEGFFATLSITDEAVENGAPDAEMIDTNASTPALALAAACCRAVAQMGEG